MASVVSALFGGGIEGAGKGIASVVNAIKGRNPEDALAIQTLLSKHEDLLAQVASDNEKAERDENVKLNDIAGQNIRAEQNDKYTARSRPTVVYAWIAVILYNYIITGLIGKAPIVMPDMFWEVSGIVITGYVFARTSDKLFGGQGGSAQLPFGIKIDSKGN